MHLGHAQAVILIGHCTYLAITEGVARTYDHDTTAGLLASVASAA
jgi:hypothetical protein